MLTVITHIALNNHLRVDHTFSSGRIIDHVQDRFEEPCDDERAAEDRCFACDGEGWIADEHPTRGWGWRACPECNPEGRSWND